jgi:hypothetical protein
MILVYSSFNMLRKRSALPNIFELRVMIMDYPFIGTHPSYLMNLLKVTLLQYKQSTV